MNYEAYEPDFEDEYYDQMCLAAYRDMFSGRSETDETSSAEYVSWPVAC